MKPYVRPIGFIRSELTARKGAPKQGSEGAPDAWIDVLAWAAEALHGLAVGDELIVITWLHEARRDVFQVHPRSNPRNPLTGVFQRDRRTGRTRWDFIRWSCERSRESPACRTNRSHRRHAGSQHQSGALLIPATWRWADQPRQATAVRRSFSEAEHRLHAT